MRHQGINIEVYFILSYWSKDNCIVKDHASAGSFPDGGVIVHTYRNRCRVCSSKGDETQRPVPVLVPASFDTGGLRVTSGFVEIPESLPDY